MSAVEASELDVDLLFFTGPGRVAAKVLLDGVLGDLVASVGRSDDDADRGVLGVGMPVGWRFSSGERALWDLLCAFSNGGWMLSLRSLTAVDAANRTVALTAIRLFLQVQA